MGCGPWEELEGSLSLSLASSGESRSKEGYLRAEEIGKRLEGWAMARVELVVLDGEESFVNCWVAVHDDVVELGWGSGKGERRRCNIYGRMTYR